jgi:hypothetical protein
MCRAALVHIFEGSACSLRWKCDEKDSSQLDAKFGSDDREDCRPFGLDAFHIQEAL